MLNDYLRHISNSLLFMYQRPFSHDWDAYLTQLMDEGEVISADQFCVMFFLHGQHHGVWVGNRWCSYGHLYELNGQYTPRENQYRPRFRTMRRLNQLHRKASQPWGKSA